MPSVTVRYIGALDAAVQIEGLEFVLLHQRVPIRDYVERQILEPVEGSIGVGIQLQIRDMRSVDGHAPADGRSPGDSVGHQHVVKDPAAAARQSLAKFLVDFVRIQPVLGVEEARYLPKPTSNVRQLVV